MTRAFILIALMLAATACTSPRQRNENAMFGAISQHIKENR